MSLFTKKEATQIEKDAVEFALQKVFQTAYVSELHDGIFKAEASKGSDAFKHQVFFYIGKSIINGDAIGVDLDLYSFERLTLGSTVTTKSLEHFYDIFVKQKIAERQLEKSA